MPTERATQLATRLLDGTATLDERREYEALYPVCSICSVCGGSFQSAEYTSNGGRCSQCGTELFRHSSDRVGHEFHDIVPSIPSDEALGVFCVAYLPAGVNWCEKCGLAFPRSYTCCPGVLNVAIRLHREQRKDHGQAALSYINEHSETLCNMLRGSFKLDDRTLRYFRKRVLPLLDRREELERILES